MDRLQAEGQAALPSYPSPPWGAEGGRLCLRRCLCLADPAAGTVTGDVCVPSLPFAIPPLSLSPQVYRPKVAVCAQYTDWHRE